MIQDSCCAIFLFFFRRSSPCFVVIIRVVATIHDRLKQPLEAAFRNNRWVSDGSMPRPADTRKNVGSTVFAKAIHVTADAECSRRYGAQKKTKFIQGTVVGSDSETGRSNRLINYVTADYVLGVDGTIKRKRLNIRSVKDRNPRQQEATQQQGATTTPPQPPTALAATTALATTTTIVPTPTPLDILNPTMLNIPAPATLDVLTPILTPMPLLTLTTLNLPIPTTLDIPTRPLFDVPTPTPLDVATLTPLDVLTTPTPLDVLTPTLLDVLTPTPLNVPTPMMPLDVPTPTTPPLATAHGQNWHAYDDETLDYKPVNGVVPDAFWKVQMAIGGIYVGPQENQQLTQSWGL